MTENAKSRCRCAAERCRPTARQIVFHRAPAAFIHTILLSMGSRPTVQVSVSSIRKMAAGDGRGRARLAELTYTANDMALFARDMGYVDAAGEVKPRFAWDEERRMKLRAKLDAVFFHLYGITDREDVRYIYSTFPIVERQEKDAYGGRYRSWELCLAYMNALAAGDPDAAIDG